MLKNEVIKSILSTFFNLTVITILAIENPATKNVYLYNNSFIKLIHDIAIYKLIFSITKETQKDILYY